MHHDRSWGYAEKVHRLYSERSYSLVKKTAVSECKKVPIEKMSFSLNMRKGTIIFRRACGGEISGPLERQPLRALEGWQSRGSWGWCVLLQGPPRWHSVGCFLRAVLVLPACSGGGQLGSVNKYISHRARAWCLNPCTPRYSSSNALHGHLPKLVIICRFKQPSKYNTPLNSMSFCVLSL